MSKLVDGQIWYDPLNPTEGYRLLIIGGGTKYRILRTYNRRFPVGYEDDIMHPDHWADAYQLEEASEVRCIMSKYNLNE